MVLSNIRCYTYFHVYINIKKKCKILNKFFSFDLFLFLFIFIIALFNNAKSLRLLHK